MEHIEASRRLRKSLLNKLDSVNIGDFEIYGKNDNIINDKDENKLYIGFKNKLYFKTIFSVILVLACLCVKMTGNKDIGNNKVIRYICNEYRKDYQKEDVTNMVENFCRKNKAVFSYVIPQKFIVSIKNEYYSVIKDKYINFNVKNIFNSTSMYGNSSKEASVYLYSNNVENVENSEKIDEEKAVTVNTKNISPLSSISSMEEDIKRIKEKNISMIQPVNGTVTSVYGARKEIIKGVGTFHTGVDIANVINTDVKSVTTGKVTNIEENNKYYGNNITITTSGVEFKYAHLNSIEVKLNQEVKQGDIIAKMGSTGYSTGSHLHLEISIDSRTVDPQRLIDIR